LDLKIHLFVPLYRRSGFDNSTMVELWTRGELKKVLKVFN
jgi:hypothetical protein